MAKPVILALNKIDRVQPRSALAPVLEIWGRAHPFAAIVPISARGKDGLDRLLDELVSRLPLGEHPYDAETLSDRPVRYFVSEYVREQVLARTRQEVPHGVAVTIDSFDEEARIPRIALTVHVDKESHKKILIGAAGSMLRSIGEGARHRVEALLGQKVHLQIWVRVTPGWYENDTTLAEFGYADSR